jgi:hypothetical protein
MIYIFLKMKNYYTDDKFRKIFKDNSCGVKEIDVREEEREREEFGYKSP